MIANTLKIQSLECRTRLRSGLRATEPTDTGDELQTLRGHTADVTSVLFTPDGTRIVSAGEDNTVRIWDACSYKLLKALEGHTHSVMCLAVSPDGNLLASASKEAIRVWKLK